VTHPSEPNYVAAIGGDYFGMNNDNFNFIDANVSTVIDLLEAKGISWGEYQEDMPYSGFEGFAWVNQQNGKNDYVRKHNPAIVYNSVAEDDDRIAKVKNLTMFYEDLENEKLPQWMFITPNMTSDAHDSSVTVAGSWTRSFLEPLWNLPTLGRWDVGANVWQLVADRTGDKVQQWSGEVPLSAMYWNQSYDGVFNSQAVHAVYPKPNLCLKTEDGRKVSSIVGKTWKGSKNPTYYEAKMELPDGMHPPAGYSPAA
jgi:hypothetical protein